MAQPKNPAPQYLAPGEESVDLSDVICRVGTYVSILARSDPEIHGRLVYWALKVLQADGRPLEPLISMIEKRPTPSRQWWLLRQYLKPEAMGVLLRHLQAALAQQR